MKIALKHVFFGQPVVQKLVNHAMPIKVAFQFSKLLKKLTEEYQHIEEQRTNLIKKHGKEVEQGKFQVKDENVEQFTSEMAELLEEETELDIKPVDMSLVPDDVKLTPQELLSIEYIFEQSEEPQKPEETEELEIS